MKNKSKDESFISIVLVQVRTIIEPHIFENYIRGVYLYLEQNYSNYEIVLVDQGNINIPVEQKQSILLSIPSIRWLTLSSNVEDEDAFNAGVENTIGDYIVLLRVNIDPLDIIKNMVLECSQGFDLVTGVVLSESTFGYKVFRKVSDKVLKLIEYDIPKNSSPVRCMSRTAISVILQTGMPGHQLYMKLSKAYPQSKVYEYKMLENSQIHKRNLYDGIKKTMHLMVFNSTKPLRWASIMGVLGSVIALIFSFYSILVNILKDNVQEGWTSTILFSSIQFIILFVMLGFIGEYLGRLLSQSHNQKGYYIASEENSSVMLTEDRLNVQHIKE